MQIAMLFRKWRTEKNLEVTYLLLLTFALQILWTMLKNKITCNKPHISYESG